MALTKGSTLWKNRYQVQKLLARGGFGFIYLALDQLNGRQVVIKELIPALISDTDVLRRFIREGRTLQRLNHPNIVRAETMFKERDHHYLIMEYLNGGVLSDWLEQGRQLALGETIMIALALCDAIDYLHQMGITHCDLQPGNILFDQQGHPKLIDLGIAHVPDELVHRPWRTERDLAIGTVFYMSPEQLEGVRDDPRIDIYALGTLLYHMLAGRHYLNFDLRNTAGARADNVALVRTSSPEPIPHVPGSVNTALLKALEKQPAQRYPTITAFRQALLQVTLPYLSPSTGDWIVAPFPQQGATQFAWKPQTDEWPRWVWPALIAANLGIMLLAALLLLTMT